MTVPGLVSAVVEPVLGILADTRLRRAILLGGGVAFMLSVFLTGASTSAGLLLASWIVFYPASGAFVNVAQIGLMDLAPQRREQNMARWSLAGSLGMAAGPIALGGAAALGLGWRGLYFVMAAVSAALVAPTWRAKIPRGAGVGGRPRAGAGGRRRGTAAGWRELLQGARGALRALRSRSVLRWLLLLELSDLMIDILFGFVALYFVDVAGAPVGMAAAAVVIWTVSGLAGDVLVIPVLERSPGLLYLRASAAAAAALFPAFLIVHPLLLKMLLLALLGVTKAGWYSVLKAKLYASLPGKGGAAMAVSNVAGLAGSLIPLGLGAVAQAAGLGATMWLLMAAPVALLVGLPRVRPATARAESGGRGRKRRGT